ncbi:hypothetical protein BDV96DRAFT_654562 [Lophiotrema nucula]|uniref:Uncharacterized protein n=1 Tax=Lophiotrema nucula TaxID=690887 RepID=A0A6A5YJP5_9PLEO|nr:hypothetical protein BDV96DRAFT_654562 [Lophiotrema nucula]
MIPGAGLFLRESLYTKQPPLTEPPDSYAVKPRPVDRKRFQRTVTERKSFERTSIDRKSMAARSSENVSNAFMSLSTVFNFVDFVSSLGKVSDENAVFVNLIQRVQQDLDEALRLLSNPVVEDYYDSFPDRWNWIEHVLADAQKALNEVGVYVENVGVSGDDGGTVKMRQKFDWVLTHHQKLLSREHALTICHQSLMVAISNMREVEMGVGSRALETPGIIPGMYEAPAQPWLQVEDRDILRSPYSRQKWRLSQRNLSLPSITVSDHEGAKLETQSVNSVPVELPGSTPDDLAHPENLDLYALPPNPRKSLDQPSASRMFFDQVKPRRSLDQLTTSRTSFDKSSRPLSILVESTAADNTKGEIPGRAPTAKVARRYRPKAIDVRKPQPKHHSLPTELPYLPIQPSLITELSNWVLPDAHEETPTSITASSPDLPTSAASCPSIMQREPASSPVMTNLASSASFGMPGSEYASLRRKPLRSAPQPQSQSQSSQPQPTVITETPTSAPSLESPKSQAPTLASAPAPPPIPEPQPQQDAPADSPTSIYTSGTIPISLDTTSPTTTSPMPNTSAGLARTTRTARPRRGLSRVPTASSEAPSSPSKDQPEIDSATVIDEEQNVKDGERGEGSRDPYRASLGYMSGGLPIEEEVRKADSVVDGTESKSPVQAHASAVGAKHAGGEGGEEAIPTSTQAKRRRDQARRMKLAYGSD